MSLKARNEDIERRIHGLFIAIINYVFTVDDSKERVVYTCAVYATRPGACVEYPWNLANAIFKDCIFIDDTHEEPQLRTMKEQLEINTEQEISDFCMSCGKCCFIGPAACSQLRITKRSNDNIG